VHVALAIALATATIVLLITRPRGLNEGLAALLGAVAFVVLGLVTPGQAFQAIANDWNVFLFFLGLMAVAGLAEQAGLFDWLASWAAAHAFGSVRLLFLYVVLITSGVTLLLTNDTAALILTPIVYALVAGFGLEPLPFMFATTFLANASSLGLPISNPINFLLADSFGIALPTYASHLWLAEIGSIVVTSLALFWLFRQDIGGRIEDSVMTRPVRSAAILTTGLILAALITAYIIASVFGFPLGIVAIAGAIVLIAAARLRHDLHLTELAQIISWPIFGFLAGMLVVIRGLTNVGAIAAFGHALLQLGGGHLASTIGVTMGGAALGSNIINNLPMAVTLAATLHQHLVMAAKVHAAAVYSTILGCDLGPNLTHLGSLSSMIWLLLLRRRGLEVSVLDYVRVGALLTPLALVVTAAALYVSTR
jgi:arsenical pump membrane protein